MIKVAVCGANGKMGKQTVQAVLNSQDMELAASIDINNGQYKTIEEAKNSVNFDVLIDFTQPNSVYNNAKFCLNNGVNIVIGTTGLSDVQISELKELSEKNKLACLVIPNFSTGAVLMMKFAQIAAKYFDNAEIIEYHHNQKKDAPSGTAIKTAQMMGEVNTEAGSYKNFTLGNCPETETITGARGGTSYNNIHIHSVRMPGYMASQEVLLGSSGQILSLRHDSVDRECYMPGVLLAVRYAAEHKKFLYGLDKIMD